jgi:hypothetical protein
MSSHRIPSLSLNNSSVGIFVLTILPPTGNFCPTLLKGLRRLGKVISLKVYTVILSRVIMIYLRASGASRSRVFLYNSMCVIPTETVVRHCHY